MFDDQGYYIQNQASILGQSDENFQKKHYEIIKESIQSREYGKFFLLKTSTLKNHEEKE